MNQEKYNLIRLGKEVVINYETVIGWCQQQNLMPSERICENCNQPMGFRPDHGLGTFRCRRKILFISIYLFIFNNYRLQHITFNCDRYLI